MKAQKETKKQSLKESDDLRRRVKKQKTEKLKSLQAVTTLKESEIRFRNIIENSKDGIIFFDGKTRKIILGNKAMAKLLGCSKKALIGRSILSLHPPEEWASIEKSFKKHLRGELTVSAGIPILRNDGSVFYADIFSSLTMLEGRTCFSAFFRDITERKRAEEALRESEERFRLAFENANTGVCLVDLEGNLTKVNNKMCETFGYTKEELERMTVNDIAHPEDIDKSPSFIQKTLRGEIDRGAFEKRYFHKKGHVVTCQVSSSLVYDSEGAPLYFISHVHDLTDRKRAEEALRESEEKYRNLVERANDGISIGQDGIIQFANERLALMGGYSVEELVGAPFFDFFMPEEFPKVFDFYQRRMDGEDIPTIYETALRHKDGSRIEVELNAGIISYKGKPADLVLFRDITRRKQVLAALREREETFRALAENANDGIFITVGKGIQAFANKRAGEITGYSKAELLKTGIQDLIHPDEVQKIMERYKKRLAGEPVPTQYETVIIRKDRKSLPIELTASKTIWHGQPADLVIIRDISQRKQTEELLRANEARLKAQYQGSPIPTFTWQKKGETFELVDFNQTAQVATQGETKKYLGKTAAEMYQDRQEVLQDIHRCFTEKKVIKRELQSQHFMPGRTIIATYAFVPPDLIMVHAEDITERKRMEEALLESEEKFRNVFDNASIGMSMASLDGSVYVNQAFSEILGYTKEEMSGLKWQDFTHPDDIELTQEFIEQLLSGEKTSVRFMKRYITKDGSTLWGDLNTVLQKDKNGNPLYYISALLDISERKRWEALIERTIRETHVRFEVSQALAGQETEDEVLDALIQQANFYPHVHTSIVTFEKVGGELIGTLRRVDPFASGVITVVPLGMRFPASQYTSINQYVIDESFVSEDISLDERMDHPAREMIQQSGGTSFAAFPLTAGNEWMGIITAIAKPIGYFDKEKQHLYQTLAEQGAVALRAARLREQIRESQKRFQGLVETLNDSIWEVDQDGNFTYVSPKIRDLLGVEPEELLGKTPFDFMPPEEAQRVSSLFEPLKAARQPLIALENTCRHKDGHLVVFETSGLPFFNSEGQFKGYRGVDRDITERKQTQKALQISEERFRIAAESSNDFIYEWDLNTGQLEWFGAATERLNHIFSEPPVTTAAFEKSIHPEDYERISKAVRRQVRYGEPYRQEYRLIGKTGDIFHIQTAGKCLRDENGWAYKWIGTTSDITERKGAEEALLQAEEKYRAIVENAVEGIFQSTSDGKFLMVNTAVAKFHGYDSPQELIADISNIGEQLYVHPEDRQRYRRILADEGVVKGFEAQFYRKDGTIKWGSMNIRSVRDNEGRILHYEGTIEDITARKEAEEGLQKSLEKLRKALGGIIQAMSLTVETRDPYTAGHQRRVADLARAIAQEMGLPEDQVDALRMAGIVHDLGKISIPAEILSKPAQLSDIEFSLIKAHPQISYDILKDIDFNWPVAQIVLQHHERINGSGYPQGLSGKAIYLEARILAVADVVEAISSHRPYRPAYGVDVALEEISKNKDVLYDPEAVEACLRLFKEKGFKFE